jgi:hypothetical protein
MTEESCQQYSFSESKKARESSQRLLKTVNAVQPANSEKNNLSNLEHVLKVLERHADYLEIGEPYLRKVQPI